MLTEMLNETTSALTLEGNRANTFSKKRLMFLKKFLRKRVKIYNMHVHVTFYRLVREWDFYCISIW